MCKMMDEYLDKYFTELDDIDVMVQADEEVLADHMKAKGNRADRRHNGKAKKHRLGRLAVHGCQKNCMAFDPYFVENGKAVDFYDLDFEERAQIPASNVMATRTTANYKWEREFAEADNLKDRYAGKKECREYADERVVTQMSEKAWNKQCEDAIHAIDDALEQLQNWNDYIQEGMKDGLGEADAEGNIIIKDYVPRYCRYLGYDERISDKLYEAEREILRFNMMRIQELRDRVDALLAKVDEINRQIKELRGW